MQKKLLIIEFFRHENLISIEVASTIENVFDNYVDFNIYDDSTVAMKAKAYDYIIDKLKKGYIVQDIERAYISRQNVD